MTHFTKHLVGIGIIHRQYQTSVRKATVGHMTAFTNHLVGLTAQSTTIARYVFGRLQGGCVNGMISLFRSTDFIDMAHLTHVRVLVSCSQKNGFLNSRLCC